MKRIGTILQQAIMSGEFCRRCSESCGETRVKRNDGNSSDLANVIGSGGCPAALRKKGQDDD